MAKAMARRVRLKPVSVEPVRRGNGLKRTWKSPHRWQASRPAQGPLFTLPVHSRFLKRNLRKFSATFEKKRAFLGHRTAYAYQSHLRTFGHLMSQRFPAK